jgi:hypothetical protein
VAKPAGLNTSGNEGCASCGRSIDVAAPTRIRVAAQANDAHLEGLGQSRATPADVAEANDQPGLAGKLTNRSALLPWLTAAPGLPQLFRGD